MKKTKTKKVARTTKKALVGKKMVLVRETVHDSWSGPEDYTYSFDTLKLAEAYVKKVNGKNTLPYVPDYYVTATIIQK